MAKTDEKTEREEKPEVIQTGPRAGETVEETPRYPIATFQEYSTSMFGHGAHVVVGALSFAKLENRKTLTQAQVQDAIDRFLAQEDKSHKVG